MSVTCINEESLFMYFSSMHFYAVLLHRRRFY